MTQYSTYDDFLQCVDDVGKALNNCNSCRLIMCNTIACNCTKIYTDGVNFSYTGSDQHYCIPITACYNLVVYGAGANGPCGGFSCGDRCFTKGDELSIMVGQYGGAYYPCATYGFGGRGSCNCSSGAGLTGFFTGCDAIGPNDAERAIIIAGGGGGSRCYCTVGNCSSGGGLTGGTGRCGTYGGGGGTQTGHGSQGTAASDQFCGAPSAGGYSHGGGGGWWGGNASKTGCDYTSGGGGSGYVGGVTNCVTLQNRNAPRTNGCAKLKIVY